MQSAGNYILSALFATLLLLFYGCEQNDKPTDLSLYDKKPLKELQPPKTANLIHVAVSAMISPKKTFHYYQQILDYISSQTGRPVELVQRTTYGEINDLLQKNELDLVFVCTGAYIDGHERFGMELLAAPVVYGKTVYYSYIIVHKESDIASLKDLRAKRFAFTDPMSNTGKLAPTYMLAASGNSIDTFFDQYIYTYSHDKSIEAVAKKLVDGAAVDSLVWDYMEASGSLFTAATKVIKKSEPYGIPPVVVPKGLDPALKDRLRTLLLQMHQDPRGKEILNHIHIEKFVVVEDSIYDSVRAMKKWERSKSSPAPHLRPF